MTNKMRYTYKGGEFYAARTCKQHMHSAKWQNSPIGQCESITKAFSIVRDITARRMKVLSASFSPLHSTMHKIIPHNIHFIAE